MLKQILIVATCFQQQQHYVKNSRFIILCCLVQFLHKNFEFCTGLWKKLCQKSIWIECRLNVDESKSYPWPIGWNCRKQHCLTIHFFFKSKIFFPKILQRMRFKNTYKWVKPQPHLLLIQYYMNKAKSYRTNKWRRIYCQFDSLLILFTFK